jgi:hypothetical protein
MVFALTVLMMIMGLFRAVTPQRNDEQQQKRHIHDGIEGGTCKGGGRAIHHEPGQQTEPEHLAGKRGFAAIEFAHDQPLQHAPAHQHATQDGAQNPRLRRGNVLLAIKGQKHQINQPQRGQVQSWPRGQSRQQAKADDNGRSCFQRGDWGWIGHRQVSFMLRMKTKLRLLLYENNDFRGKCHPTKRAL